MPFVRSLIRLIALTSLGGPLSSLAVAQTIVWMDGDSRKIQKKDVGGGAVQTIVQFVPPQNASQINYDPIARKLYYRSGGTPTDFQRMSIDGSNIEDIAIPTGGTFAINIESRTFYWVVGAEDDVLNYSDLNGAEVQTHTYPTCCFAPLLAVGEDLYIWGSLAADKGLYRADADGSNEQLLYEGTVPTSAAYDPVENRVYVAAEILIFRINTDGTGYQEIVQTPIGPPNMIVAIDSSSRKLYWTDSVRRVIQRSNLDGSNIETFLTASEAGNLQLDLRGLTVVLPPSIPASSAWSMIVFGIVILLSGIVLSKNLAVRCDGIKEDRDD